MSHQNTPTVAGTENLRLCDGLVVEAQQTRQLMLDSMQSTSERLARMETATKELSKLRDSPAQKPNCFAFMIPPHPSQIGQDSSPPLPVAARVIVDSGSDENWISRETVARAGLETHIIPVEEEERHYAHFGDTVIEPQGSIELTWYSENQALAKRSKFWVHDQVPFNALLGMSFIGEEGSAAVFAEPALALRQRKLNPDDLRRIEGIARKKSATNRQVVELRRAEAAAARERARQERGCEGYGIDAGY